MRIVADYPAFTVVDRKPENGLLTIKAEEVLACGFQSRRHGILYHQFKASSVISYALRDGRDPVEALRMAQERGEQLHYIFGLGSCITAHKQAKYEVTLVEVGQHVKFEGRVFEIVRAPNDNLDLREI